MIKSKNNRTWGRFRTTKGKKYRLYIDEKGNPVVFMRGEAGTEMPCYLYYNGVTMKLKDYPNERFISTEFFKEAYVPKVQSYKPVYEKRPFTSKMIQQFAKAEKITRKQAFHKVHEKYNWYEEVKTSEGVIKRPKPITIRIITS